METLEKTASVTLTNKALTELLTGLLTHADTGKNAPAALNCIKLWATGGNIYGVATDRYRLIEGWTPAFKSETDLPHQFEPVLIKAESVKAWLKELKSAGIGNSTLELADNNLYLYTGENIVASKVQDLTFPPHDYLFNHGEFKPVEVIAFNPDFLSDYAKFAQGVILKQEAKNKPYHIEFTGDLKFKEATFRALLMPIKVN